MEPQKLCDKRCPDFIDRCQNLQKLGFIGGRLSDLWDRLIEDLIKGRSGSRRRIAGSFFCRIEGKTTQLMIERSGCVLRLELVPGSMGVARIFRCREGGKRKNVKAKRVVAC